MTLMNVFIKKIICYFISLPVLALLCTPLTAHATEDARKQIPVESNEVEDWPQGPVTGAKSAIVMEADQGVLLYAKNIHERLYPASTTKLMTCLVAMEHASLSDMVPITYSAVSAVPPDGSNIGMDAGQSITMEQALYGIMVGSANEVSNAVAEYISGSISAFAELMNERAASLGLQDTHFTNANGLHDPDHYTSAYDLAVIAKAFFDNVTLSGIGGTARYHFEASATQPDDFYLRNKHALITGDVSADGVIGGKTGFTDEAGECLVTCAEKNGLRLICVVLFEDTYVQFTDSAALLEYGFDRFESVPAAGNENSLLPETPAFFLPDRSLFGRELSTLSFKTGDRLVLPAGDAFSDAAVSDIASVTSDDVVARASYDKNGWFVGSVRITLQTQTPEVSALTTGTRGALRVIYVDIRRILLYLAAAFLAVSGVAALIQLSLGIAFSPKAIKKRRLRRQKKEILGHHKSYDQTRDR